MVPMNTILKEYESYRTTELSLKKMLYPLAQRYMDFLYKKQPINVIDYRLKTLSLDAFDIRSSSNTTAIYFESASATADIEYFYVPHDYVNHPDDWELATSLVVKGNKTIARQAILDTFGDKVNPKGFKVQAYPTKLGNIRFLKVKLSPSKYTIDHPELREIANKPHHPGFILDKQTDILYRNGWVHGGKSLPKLITESPAKALRDHRLVVDKYSHHRESQTRITQ